MTLHPFEQFVRNHADWFRGYNPEPPEVLLQAEEQLQQVFPLTLKWLLSRYGYWKATGVGGLPFVVATTQSYRPQFPPHWLVLSQPTLPAAANGSVSKNGSLRQTGLVILVLDDEHPVDGKAVLICNSAGEVVQRYSGFSQYVIALQHKLMAIANPAYQRCYPDFHQEVSGRLLVSHTEFHLPEFQRRVLETILFHRLTADSTPVSALAPLAPQLQETSAAECVCYPFPVSESDSAPQTKAENRDKATRTIAQGPPAMAAGSSALPSSLSLADEEQSEPMRVEPAAEEVVQAGAAARGIAETESSPRFTALSHLRDESGAATPEPCFALPPCSLSKPPDQSANVLQTVVTERREFLQQHQQHLPTHVLQGSSSSRREYRLPDKLPEGQLLLTPAPAPDESVPSLPETLLPFSQQVTLLRHQDAAGKMHDWLLSWVPPEQSAEFTLTYFEQTRSIPAWILSAGDSLSELLPRLERLS